MLSSEKSFGTRQPLPKKRNRLAQKFMQQRYLQAMTIPGIIWMLVFIYIPIAFIIIAFKDYHISRPFFSGDWIGLQNFIDFFNDDNFMLVMKNTVGIGFLSLVIGFPIPIAFAILLNEIYSSKFKRVVQTISYLPHFLSWAVLGSILTFWLSETGFITIVLQNMGLLEQPVNLLAQPKYFWSILIISNIWKETGWSAIIYLAAIAAVDPEQYEAATVDGANRWHKIRHITLPSIKGTVLVLFILAAGNLLSTNFDQIFVLKNALNLDASNVLDLYVYKMGIEASRYGYATAIGLFRSVISLILLVCTNSISRRLSDTSLF